MDNPSMAPDVAATRAGALMVAGTASGVGKSTVTAGLCRLFAQRGLQVAPFKAQNMSNHAAVTAGGGEIGRAQAMQALAAEVEATVHMNPVLIKPGPNMTSHVVVRGREIGSMHGFEPLADNRKQIVLDSYRLVAESSQLVMAEGAGGAAEINLLDRDLVNLPFAKAAGMPAVLVVDIDRGGAFASAYGTIKILPSELRDVIQGVIINSFRGDPAYLGSGLDDLAELIGVPVLGVLPHLGPVPLLGVEDSLDISNYPTSTTDVPTLRVAVLALPHLSNPSDFDPLVLEPSVALTWARRSADVLAADLVIIPGSRATVEDLRWIRSAGLDNALRQTPAQVLGICGGYQMMGHTIDDPVESCTGHTKGLGLLDVDTVFDPQKIVRQSTGHTRTGSAVSGYQIRFGRPSLRSNSDHDSFLTIDGEPEGAQDATGRIGGTSLHGVFDADEFRRDFLTAAAARADQPFVANPLPFASQLDAQHDHLAAWVEEHLDIDVLSSIAKTAAAPDVLPGW